MDEGELHDWSEIVSQMDSEVRTMISQGRKEEAIKAAVANPPLTGEEESKRRAFASVMNAVTSFKTSEIADCVAQLDNSECDVLMKYVYRGMADPHDSYSAHLLVWHGAIVKKSGLGSISRVLTDRQHV